MNSTAHQIAGFSLLADLAAPKLISLIPGSDAEFMSKYIALFDKLLNPIARYGLDTVGVIFTVACVTLYWLGLLLPDIDVKNSAASRMLRFSVPVAHRGITHAMWIPLGLLAVSVLVPYLWALRFLALGAIAHGVADAFSTAGWAPFYPAGRYRIYRSTVMAYGPKVTLYSSDRENSDIYVAIAFLVLSLGLIAFLYYLSL